MAYWKDIWRFQNSIEYEYKYPGNYGARGEKRKKKEKATPEQIERQNQKNREKRMRRLIKANFLPGDIWATLKYPAGTRKDVRQVKKDVQNFIARLRREYKKRGSPLKFVYRLEIGGSGGIHMHLLVNRIEGADGIIQGAWTQGRANYENIYEDGGYEKLASYIVKQPVVDTPEYEQLTFLPEEQRKEFIKYSSSRNLIRPKPIRKEYKRRTVRQLIEEGPKPTPGYYIDKSSIHAGINPYTGMSYLHYTECRLDPVGRNGPPGRKE